MVGAIKYDEAAITLAAQRLTRGERTAFAAACAERLWPLVERYAATIALPSENLRVLREALDAAWAAAGGRADRLGLETAKAVAEKMIPSEDDDWVFESGYAQNGIAAIAYSIDTWLRDGVQEAVWAGRQVYEAADYGAQHTQLDTEFFYSSELEEDLFHSPVVQEAVLSILADLSMAGKEKAQVIRQRIVGEAHGFASLFP